MGGFEADGTYLHTARAPHWLSKTPCCFKLLLHIVDCISHETVLERRKALRRAQGAGMRQVAVHGEWTRVQDCSHASLVYGVACSATPALSLSDRGKSLDDLCSLNCTALELGLSSRARLYRSVLEQLEPATDHDDVSKGAGKAISPTNVMYTDGIHALSQLSESSRPHLLSTPATTYCTNMDAINCLFRTACSTHGSHNASCTPYCDHPSQSKTLSGLQSPHPAPINSSPIQNQRDD